MIKTDITLNNIISTSNMLDFNKVKLFTDKDNTLNIILKYLKQGWPESAKWHFKTDLQQCKDAIGL